VGVGAVVERLYPGLPGGDPEAEKVHPAEYYIKPPLGPDPMLGDLRVLKRGEGENIFAVVWPSCDLVHRGGKCKIERALCARALPVESFEEHIKWAAEATPSDSATKALKSLIANNRAIGQAERYHFLPAAWDIPSIVLDFQELEHVGVAELKAAPCLATVASPFAESIGARFIRYLGRLGTPDLDIELALAGLRKSGTS
jgi:hypothetical protein